MPFKHTGRVGSGEATATVRTGELHADDDLLEELAHDVGTAVVRPGPLSVPGVADLVRTTWRPAEQAGRLAVFAYPGTYLDTGTPRDYLAANLHAVHDGVLVAASATVTGRLHAAVIGAGATVEGSVTRGVVWPGGHVGPHRGGSR